MKYIDSEKLIAEIERRYHKAVDESKYINSAKFVRNELENLREFAYSLQQEQLEVDLEKVLSGFIGRYAHENSGEYPSAIDIARYFYELGLNARKEENK